MTNFFDSEIDRIFKKMSSSFFNTDDIFEEFKGNGSESDQQVIIEKKHGMEKLLLFLINDVQYKL